MLSTYMTYSEHTWCMGLGPWAWSLGAFTNIRNNIPQDSVLYTYYIYIYIYTCMAIKMHPLCVVYLAWSGARGQGLGLVPDPRP